MLEPADRAGREAVIEGEEEMPARRAFEPATSRFDAEKGHDPLPPALKWMINRIFIHYCILFIFIYEIRAGA